MIRNIKPVEVSPAIKAARYIFLLLGIIFGTQKRKAYKIIEEKEIKIRKQHIKEEQERKKEERHTITARDIERLAQDLGVEELPPGWKKSI